MNLNVLFFLIFSFCSYVVNSVNVNYTEKHESLFKEAKDEKYSLDLSVAKFYNMICRLDPDPEQLEQRLRRATTCKYAIKNLEKKFGDEYKDLYMNYSHFLKKPDCEFVDVLIPNKNTIAKQPVVLCPFRPSFIPMDTNYGLIQNSNFIAVFPKTIIKLMIFKPILKPDGKIEFWEISKIINNFKWGTHRNVLPKVFDLVLPKSYSKTQDIFNLLSNSTEHLSKKSEDSNHILNTASIPEICKIVYRPGRYNEFLNVVTRSKMYEKPNMEIVTLFSEEPGKYVQFPTLVHKCYREFITTTIIFYMDDYRMTAGPLDDSIILLHKIDNVLKVVEFVLDLNIDYINMYDSY